MPKQKLDSKIIFSTTKDQKEELEHWAAEYRQNLSAFIREGMHKYTKHLQIRRDKARKEALYGENNGPDEGVQNDT